MNDELAGDENRRCAAAIACVLLGVDIRRPNRLSVQIDGAENSIGEKSEDACAIRERSRRRRARTGFGRFIRRRQLAAFGIGQIIRLNRDLPRDLSIGAIDRDDPIRLGSHDDQFVGEDRRRIARSDADAPANVFRFRPLGWWRGVGKLACSIAAPAKRSRCAAVRDLRDEQKAERKPSGTDSSRTRLRLPNQFYFSRMQYKYSPPLRYRLFPSNTGDA